jgi:hypothetical protein
VNHEAVIAFYVGKHGARFCPGEDDREFGRAPDTLHSNDEIEFPIEDLLIEKKQGAQRLILGGSSHVSFNREVAEEGGDFGFAHFVGMPLSMKEDEASNPIDVGLFGAQAVMLYAQVPADAIQEAR